MKYKVIKHEVIAISFSGSMNKEKITTNFETNKIKKALLFAYNEYSKHEGHDLKSLQNCYSVKENDKTICTFGFYITRSDKNEKRPKE